MLARPSTGHRRLRRPIMAAGRRRAGCWAWAWRPAPAGPAGKAWLRAWSGPPAPPTRAPCVGTHWHRERGPEAPPPASRGQLQPLHSLFCSSGQSPHSGAPKLFASRRSKQALPSWSSRLGLIRWDGVCDTRQYACGVYWASAATFRPLARHESREQVPEFATTSWRPAC